MKKKVKYQDIEIQSGTFEGIPIMETITAQEQKEFVESGYGTVADLIDFTIQTSGDWQQDC